jgi:hypothetical protein
MSALSYASNLPAVDNYLYRESGPPYTEVVGSTRNAWLRRSADRPTSNG